MNMIRIVFLTTFLLLCSILGFSQEKRMSTLEYIDSFKQSAIKEMHESKVPASITLAQGILESSSGNSRLAMHGNNHFGIKCKKTWTGKVIFEDDDALQECFRAYNSAFESYRDHSEFLKNSTRYASLFKLDITDYKGWAHGLRDAGYATNKKYGHMLIGLIERYELFKYDQEEVKQDPKPKQTIEPIITKVEEKPRVEVKPKEKTKASKLNLYDKKKTIAFTKIKVKPLATNQELAITTAREKSIDFKPHTLTYNQEIKEHKAKKGESLFSIAMLYNLNPIVLQEINNLDNDNITEGQIILLSGELPKKKVVIIKKEENIQIEEEQQPIKHVVKKGETLYSISKDYNIPVSKLTSTNNIVNNTIKEGQNLVIEP